MCFSFHGFRYKMGRQDILNRIVVNISVYEFNSVTIIHKYIYFVTFRRMSQVTFYDDCPHSGDEAWI
jgi:hypothetical protein